MPDPGAPPRFGPAAWRVGGPEPEQLPWAAADRGAIPRERTGWGRDEAAPQPRLDTMAHRGETADPLRLVDAGAARPVSDRDRTFVLRVLQVLLVVVVAGQRFVLPAGSLPVPIALVAVYAAVLLLRSRGGVRYNRVRTELFVMAAAAVCLSTWVNSLRGQPLSLNSLLLLLVIYVPWVFCIATPFADTVVPVLRTFVRLMLVAAVGGAVQMLVQLAGVWSYTDYLGRLVPAGFLAQNFNTSIPIKYASPIYKANAFVFLEPSFLCQFLALAVIVAILIRAPAWQPLLLVLGMASTLSGTGILLLVVGGALIVFRLPRAIRPTYVIAAATALVVIFLTPAAGLLLDRRNETSQQGSSGSLRFVQPYTGVIRGLSEEPVRYVTGAGPGASDRLLVSNRSGDPSQAVVYTIVPKLAFEYGLVAMMIFVGFLLVAVLRGPPMPALPGAVAFMIFFLSGSLLQPHTIFTAWLLTSLWGPPVTLGASDALAALRRRQRAPGGYG